jgi:hypothetical protein
LNRRITARIRLVEHIPILNEQQRVYDQRRNGMEMWINAMGERGLIEWLSAAVDYDEAGLRLFLPSWQYA